MLEDVKYVSKRSTPTTSKYSSFNIFLTEFKYIIIKYVTYQNKNQIKQIKRFIFHLIIPKRLPVINKKPRKHLGSH